MTGCTLNARSLQRLDGVHPDLVKVVLRAAELTETPFQVVEGLRTLERQRQYVRKGASRTMRSRHLTGHAVDVAPWTGTDFDWDNIDGYRKIWAAFEAASKELGVPVEWGGNWKGFFDAPHMQLPWKQYPANSNNKPRTARDLLKAGSRTVATASKLKVGGAVTAATGVVTGVIVNDPLGAATATVAAVGQSREVVSQAREHVTWLMQPGNVSIALAVIGLLMLTASLLIISYRVEDDNDGKHVGRPE